jgi:2-haloacid dehalogenase
MEHPGRASAPARRSGVVKGEFESFRALSFDCYGTLIDWETGIAAELGRWAAAHDVSTTTAELIDGFGQFENEVERAHPAALYPDVLAMTLDRIAAQYDAAASDDERSAFGGSVGSWPPFADSPAALGRLKERFKLIILSNVDRASFTASNERLGVEFDLVITAQDVGAYKPSPKNFEALLDAIGGIGITKDELLHVAQSLYHDHEPAAAFGLPSVWIDRRHDQQGSGATPAPASPVRPRWRFPSLAAFADAASAPSDGDH